MIFADKEKNTLRILLAIFFWFIAYNGIEAFFTLYGKNHFGIPESDAARLLGQLSLLFVLFSLPAGYIGAALGRRKTIMTGIVVMAVCIALMYFLPVNALNILLADLPVLGKVPIMVLS